ncbi:uncharacterized protein C8R40DRAFT_837753 [Lentinula edodes]|uniref:uncharacterized protein n=1 Tax=Lentinula edodes TaxID=5353 RepID=UPI001E8CE1C4|nr:uncharacterized protein C8R40DRAFT_837753 [Lentinula edodes]KAH7868447.1 hypothetical protein C8R40DRAFT_837753 [Lentinula edodes]
MRWHFIFPFVSLLLLLPSFVSDGRSSLLSYRVAMILAAKIIAFNTIEAIGFAGAFAITITALLSPSIPRLSTWYLVLCSSGVYSLSMLLLAIAHAQSGAEPNSTLCLIQGALIYSAAIWLMGSVCMFSVQFYLTVLFYTKQYSGLIHRESKLLSVGMVSIFMCVTVSLLIYGTLLPHIVVRSPQQFYCHFSSEIGVSIVAVFGVLFAIVAVFCEYHTGVLLYRHWNTVDIYQQSNGTLSIGVLARLAGFSLVSILSVSSCALFTFQSASNQSFEYIILYTVVVANADVPLLGLNKSIIRAWMFWKKTGTSAEQYSGQVSGP